MITREEYKFLKKSKTEGFRWIARDKNGKLFIYQEMPRRYRTIWNFGGAAVNIRGKYFTFIKWEDEEPTKILDLIQDYEAHQVITQESKKVAIPEGYEVLSDEWLAEHSEFADGIGECYIYETVGNMEKLLIPKHEKVVIPSFVAEWIEEVKGTYTLKLLFANSDMPSSVEDWLYCNNENCEKMALAWIYGYEIEKEKEYILKFSNGQYLYNCDLGMTDESLGCKLTQAEIESVDPRLMQFAVEVE